jgi:hypothetical protein
MDLDVSASNTNPAWRRQNGSQRHRAALPDDEQAAFDPAEANGLNPNLSLSTNSIIMQDPHGETSNPSSPVSGDVFSTCWGNGSLTPCTAGSFTTPPPTTTASLSAYPTKINPGQASTLMWSSTNDLLLHGNGFTPAETWGSDVVYPIVSPAPGWWVRLSHDHSDGGPRPFAQRPA